MRLPRLRNKDLHHVVIVCATVALAVTGLTFLKCGFACAIPTDKSINSVYVKSPQLPPLITGFITELSSTSLQLKTETGGFGNEPKRIIMRSVEISKTSILRKSLGAKDGKTFITEMDQYDKQIKKGDQLPMYPEPIRYQLISIEDLHVGTEVMITLDDPKAQKLIAEQITVLPPRAF